MHVPHWKVDTQRLHLAVETVRAYRRISARDVAQEIGIPPSTLTRLKEGHRLDVDAFVSILSWLRADPKQFVRRVDGRPSEDDDKVTVNRRDALIAWSWAQEAMTGLPDRLMPSEGAREPILAALQRLHDEVGSAPSGEEALYAPLAAQEEPGGPPVATASAGA